MFEDDDSSSQPKRIENRAELLRKGDEPKVEAIRRRVKAIEREALHSHAMPDELARAFGWMCSMGHLRPNTMGRRWNR